MNILEIGGYSIQHHSLVLELSEESMPTPFDATPSMCVPKPDRECRITGKRVPIERMPMDYLIPAFQSLDTLHAFFRMDGGDFVVGKYKVESYNVSVETYFRQAMAYGKLVLVPERTQRFVDFSLLATEPPVYTAAS